MGQIKSRAQELSGPKSADGSAEGSTNCYAPAYYVAPEDGIYSVVFYGPIGANGSGQGGPSRKTSPWPDPGGRAGGL